MNPDPLNVRVEAALRQLTSYGARVSVTAQLGIPRSSLYRNAAARELIIETHVDA